MKKNSLLVYFFTLTLIILIIETLNSEPINSIRCEVLESSMLIKIKDNLVLQYLIIRQADDAEQMIFSNWLKNKSGSSVIFNYRDRKYKGYLIRLKMCFGRGILIFKTNEIIPAKSIISIVK